MALGVRELLASRERLGITEVAGPVHGRGPVGRPLLWERGGRRRAVPDRAVLICPPEAADSGAVGFRDAGEGLCGLSPSCIALAASAIPAPFKAYAQRTGTPVFASRFDPWLLHSRLTGLVREVGRRRVQVHGTLISLAGLGVLLTGESGIGKTAAALCAMHSRNRWVADDAVVLQARAQRLYGRGHRRTGDWIAVRGRGLVRAEALLGSGRLLRETPVDLVVRLVRRDAVPEVEMAPEWCTFAGVRVPLHRVTADGAPADAAGRLMELAAADIRRSTAARPPAGGRAWRRGV